MTQEALAEKLGITRKKLQSIESGIVKSPQAEDMINVSDLFKISVDSLLRIELRRLSELKLRELEAGNDTYVTGSGLRVLSVTVNERNNENMEYVPVKAKAGYQSSYSDPEFLASLPRFSMPNLPKGRTFRMFPTVGDSMLPIPEGSDVVCSYVQDWTSIKPNTPCVVILKGEQDFVFKQVTVQQDGHVRLESLNPAYTPYTVSTSEILEIWKYYKYQTASLPEPASDMQKMSDTINKILSEIKILKRNCH